MKTEGMRYVPNLRMSIISIRYYSNCKRYSLVKYYNVLNQCLSLQINSKGNRYNFIFDRNSRKSLNFGSHYGEMYTRTNIYEKYTPAMRTVKSILDHQYVEHMEKKIFMHKVR